EAVIENAKLKLQARSVGREDEHALERGDRRFVIADLRGERGIFKSDVEIARVLKHQPQQRLAAILDLISRCRSRIRGGKSRRRSAHAESDSKRHRGLPSRPPT